MSPLAQAERVQPRAPQREVPQPLGFWSWRLRREVALGALLLLAAGLMLFYDLGAKGLWEPDEARYAEMAREMIVTGDYLLPHLHFVKHLHKPPFILWWLVASFKAFGMNEFAVRFPIVLFSLGTLLATYLMGKRLYGAGTGFLAGLVLLTSPLYAMVSRIATIDILLTLLVTAGLAFYMLARYEGRRLFSDLFFAMLGLSFFAKGFSGVVVMLAAVLLDAWLTRAPLRGILSWKRGLLIFAILALPWYVAACLKVKGLLQYLVFDQTVARVVGERHHDEPFYYFLPVLAGGFFPWSLFLPSALVRAWRERADHPLGVTLAAGFLAGFVFFSCLSSKLSTYLLPILPMAAILVARFLGLMLAGRVAFSRGLFFWVPFVAAAAGFVGLQVFLRMDESVPFVGLGDAFFVLSLTILCFMVLLSAFFFARRRRATLGLFLALNVFAYFFVVNLFPRLPDFMCTRRLAERIMEEWKPGEIIGTYLCEIPSLGFYTQSRVMVVSESKEMPFDRSADYQDFIITFKPSGFEQLIKARVKPYAVSSMGMFIDAHEAYERPLYYYDHTDEYVLYSNQPSRLA